MDECIRKLKPVKIRSYKGVKKFGVAAKDLKELVIKGCNLLQLKVPGVHVCLHEDGTGVTEEFFTTLPANTELVLLTRGQTWDGALCDNIDTLLGSDWHASGLIKAAKELLSGQKSPKMRKILTDLLKNLEDKSELESREEDEDWFQGVESRFKTKSAYMKYNCESRIRGYMKEIDAAGKTLQKAGPKKEYLKTSKELAEMLKAARYNGCYFDRTEKESSRLCTREGWFTCQGSFDEQVCASLHSINPYGSRDSRIIFSTWNLDHRIEKKRTIIPSLLEALETHKSAGINSHYFYQMLFTRENLKLVHIVCHKKGAHGLECDEKKILKRPAKEQKGQSKNKRLILTF